MSSDAAAFILVVDDVAANRALAQATLEDEGYRVVTANSAEDAIAVVTRERPDCVLMDIRMPGMDGITAVEQIRRLPNGADLAIIFVTAQREVATFDRAVAAHADDFITKPYRPDELVLRVRTAMRMARLAAERGDLVTELKLQREQLQRLELHKEQLVAFVVHDFKNPVNAIDLQATRVLRNPGDASRASDAAARIKDEAATLLRLITNLLDISRADEQALAPVRQAINADELVRAACEELSIRAADAKVRLTHSSEADTIHADRDLLRRVLVNLIDNALRHAPEESEVRIRVEAREDSVDIVVMDSGPGIPVEQRESVFDRFFRGSDSRASNRGLGLAFCKVAVEVHGGTIAIEDAQPGAAFRIRLPR